MEHQETECNFVLAGGKVKVKFCVTFLLDYLRDFFLVFYVLSMPSLLFQY